MTYHPSQRNTEDDIYISTLDPLEADCVLKKLPEMNASRDTNSIICTIKILMPELEQIKHYTFHQALAVVRDIGIFAGSLKKHGIEPVEAVPSLEPVFVNLGKMTDMVPRDTLMHYCLWNPQGERGRRHTAYIDETRLIESGKIAIPRLECAIYDLSSLHTIPIDTPEFVLQCRQCEENLTGMVEAIVYAIKKVSRKIFAEELRAYFDPIIVQGKEFLGPGAVEMPLFIFDHLLWSAECMEEPYLEFRQALLPYCLPKFRKLYTEFEAQPSLLTKVCRELKTAPAANNTILDGANALMKLFHILIKFRKPHIKVVDEAYIAENHIREKGSGGYHLETLNYITALTSNAMIHLSKHINQHLS
ncbi:Monodechloroaminopyrrolnitrin synthase PrnB [Cylindrospermum sp. NIES-4074]|nr:Monodechloroaminopyrrolnitrin synthase PrnB [Cylindrospermum sp. NIES-4074]